MSMYGDGREERLSAALIELEGMKPKWVAKRNAYWARRKEAREIGEAMGKEAMIEALIAQNPSYIRELLETEDERFGAGSLADRYAGTFMQSAFSLPKEDAK